MSILGDLTGSSSSTTTLPGYTAKSTTTTKVGNVTSSYSLPTVNSTYNIVTGKMGSTGTNTVSPSGGTQSPSTSLTPSAAATEGGVGGVTQPSSGFSLSNPLDLALIGVALVIVFLIFRKK
jgi:hypothetical protein